MADFSPIINQPNLIGYSGQQPFKFWCQTVLPLVYDDSLSYYELLNKVVAYLNNTITDVANVETNVDSINDTMNENMQNLLTAYNQLQGYVNSYFNNLDVQQEIDNKLDEMASSGSLSALLAPFIPNLVSSWLSANVNPVGSAVTVDSSLSIAGSAADSKVVGETFNNLNSPIINVYTHNGTQLLPNAETRRWFYPQSVPKNTVLQALNFYARTNGTETSQSIVIEIWRKTASNFNRVARITKPISVNTNLTSYNININYFCDFEAWLSIRLTNAGHFGSTIVTDNSELSYYSTDISNITLGAINTYNNASLAGNITIINLANDYNSKVVNYLNYSELLPSLDDYSLAGVYSIVLDSAHEMPIIGLPSAAYFGGSRNYFISIVANAGSHTFGDTQIMINKENRQAIRAWNGTAWLDWVYSKLPDDNYDIITLVNYLTRLPSLNDFTENALFGLVVQSPMETNISGYPQETGFTGAYNIFMSIVKNVGSHTFGDMQIIRNRYNKTATRTYTNNGWSEWVYALAKSDFVVEISPNGYGFAEGLKKAMNDGNTTNQNIIIRVKPGVYDLTQELSSYFETASSVTECLVNKDCTIIFDSGAEVVCNYMGENDWVKQNFSIITQVQGSMKLINAKLTGANIRYCVHDEHAASNIPYHNEYIDCQMYLDNSQNTWTLANCIGSGWGQYAHIDVVGGIYHGVRASISDKSDIRFHNANSNVGISHVSVKNVYMYSTIGLYSNGTMTTNSLVEISGCHMDIPPTIGRSTGATIDNIDVVAWNNEIINS